MNWTLKRIQDLKAAGKILGFKVLGQKGDEPKAKRSKYGNQKIVIDGFEFDSKKEATRYMDLKVMALTGEITTLQRQVEFEMHVDGKKIASYIADFVYYRNGTRVVEDVKSKATRKLRVYRLKKKLMAAIHGIEIQEY